MKKMLILIIVIALVIYYLSQEKPAQKPFNKPNIPLPVSPKMPVVKPFSLHIPPTTSLPAQLPVIELPSDIPVPDAYFPSAIYETQEPSLTKPDFFTNLQEDCAEYLAWQTGSITNKWYLYWEKTRQKLTVYSTLERKEKLKQIITSLKASPWDSTEKKKRQQSLVRELEKLVLEEP